VDVVERLVRRRMWGDPDTERWIAERLPEM
jgi:hypothetical protein